ncbi:MAG: transposase [Okeania sp. SIO3I5]|nr:transposase [Okeania sp. SIO3I5]
MTTKIVSSGGTVVVANQWFPSSKTCHNCGPISIRIKVKRPYYSMPSLWNKE